MITPINFLKPLEKVFLYHLKNLSKMIVSKGIVQTPIIADKKHGIVLDGSHRYIFFLMNGFFSFDLSVFCSIIFFSIS